MKMQELDNILDKSFRAEPDFQLSADFSQKIGTKILRREQSKIDLQEYFLLSAVVAGLILLVAGIYYLVDKVLILRVFNFISENIVQVVMVLFLLNFIFFADRVLLRFFFTRRNKA